jgi:hypothetical protein
MRSVYARAAKKPALINSRGEDIAQIGRMGRLNKRSGSVIQSAHTPMVDERSGEYNANDNGDLIDMMQVMLAKMKKGELSVPKPAMFDAEEDISAEGHLVQAAFADETPNAPGSAWQVLGEVFTDSIYETMGRTAFADKVLAHQEVPEQGIARIRIHRKDIIAWAMAGDGVVAESFIKQGWHFPKLFDLDFLAVMQEAEIHEAGAQLLEEKYQDALEATLVREDRMLKFLLDQAAQAPNDVLVFSNFTPTAFAALRRQIQEWGIGVPHMLISIDIMDDLFKDLDWQGWYDPIAKHELFLEGRFGKLGDVEILTDGLRYPELKVLNQGEVYFLGAPQALGVKSLAIPMRSKVVDQSVIGRFVRGWAGLQREALSVVNSRSVSRGIRG